VKWGFMSFIFALDRLIRTARDHRDEMKDETAIQHPEGTLPGDTQGRNNYYGRGAPKARGMAMGAPPGAALVAPDNCGIPHDQQGQYCGCCWVSFTLSSWSLTSLPNHATIFLALGLFLLG
jgi:hypothetical protein